MNQPKKLTNILLSSTQIVALLVVPVIVCLLLGNWLDKILYTSPWLLIIGVITGFSTSIWNTYKIITNTK